MDATADIRTAHGSKYLQQLCKHWSHKLEVEYDAHHGRVAFPTSAVRFAATAETLTMTLSAPDAATLDRMEPVVAEHLGRFAFREELVVAWVRAGAG